MAKKTEKQYLDQLCKELDKTPDEIMWIVNRWRQLPNSSWTSNREVMISMVRSNAQHRRYEREATEARYGTAQETVQETSIKVPEVLDFGEDTPLILVEVSGQNLNSTNRKLRLVNGDVQLTFLPRSAKNTPFKGKGALKIAQGSACAHNCLFRVKAGSDNPEMLGGCYVNHLKEKFVKVRKFYERDYPRQVTIRSTAMVRCSIWGDLGRLNKDAQSFVLRLLKFCESRTVYVSDWHNVEGLQGLGLASCQSPVQVEQALDEGLKVYAGTKAAWQALRERNQVVYKCPVKGDGSDPFGCRTCPIKCDGARNVVAWSVHSTHG